MDKQALAKALQTVHARGPLPWKIVRVGGNELATMVDWEKYAEQIITLMGVQPITESTD